MAPPPPPIAPLIVFAPVFDPLSVSVVVPLLAPAVIGPPRFSVAVALVALFTKLYVPAVPSRTSGALTVCALATDGVTVIEPPLVSSSALPVVVPNVSEPVRLPPPLSKTIFWRLRPTSTTGAGLVVLKLLNVAVSVLAVPLVAPGATPDQLPASTQTVLFVPVQVVPGGV